MSTPEVKVLLLAGGLGTRLRPLTDRVPKCLVPIAGRPLLDYWIDLFVAAGVTEVVINTHHLHEQVRAYIAQINASGRLRMRESYEPVLLGSAGTVHANRDLVREGDTALIVYADNLSNVNLGAFLNYHHGHGMPATMMLFRAAHPERCGIAQLDRFGTITEFIEKPREPKSNLANAGLYALTSQAYHEIADMNRFDLGFDILPEFVGRMRGWVWDGYHLDVGTPEALERAEKDVVGGLVVGAGQR